MAIAAVAERMIFVFMELNCFFESYLLMVLSVNAPDV